MSLRLNNEEKIKQFLLPKEKCVPKMFFLIIFSFLKVSLTKTYLVTDSMRWTRAFRKNKK